MLAGPEYEAGALRRFLVGDGYRHLWATPVEVPLLDLQREVGGLRPIRVGGGFQTQTIHLRGGDDGYYLFRSVNKAVRKGLEPDLQDTPAGWLVQEHTSAFHPAGGWVVPPLLEAVGVPQSMPRLFIMPDDPALGEHREAFAGVLGMLVESPDKGESGKKRFRGSDDIAGSGDLMELLEASPAHRVDARPLLASRLVDLIVGDPDRNFDNFRWIGFDSTGFMVWRPVPMDRDPAFLRGDGIIGWVARNTFLPKLMKFNAEYEDVRGLWASQPEVDRLLLAELDRPVWDSVVAAVQTALTDGTIDAAVAAMPPEYVAADDGFLARAMKSRRDQLHEAADRFYRDLAGEVDVQATAAADVAEVERRPDGTVAVALHTGCAQGAALPLVCERTYFRRVFLPEETREVRVYLRGGDDRAVVHGEGPHALWVRIVAGAGNDRVQDLSRARGTPVRNAFYGEPGDELLGAGGTRVVRAPWEGRVITDFVTENKSGTYRDYGSRDSWSPLPDYDRSAGVILGVRHRTTRYGFRREPWAQQLDLSGQVSLQGGFGGGARLRRRVEGSDVILSAHARGSRALWSYRFYGFGNDGAEVGSDLALVPADEVRAGGDVELPLGRGATLTLGPELRWLRPDPHPEGPLALSGRPGAEAFGQAGLAGRLALRRVDDDAFPRRGLDLRAGAAAWAPLQGERDLFGSATGEARGYLPAPLGSVLAARLGAGLAWGGFPAHEAMFLGGRRSLRGYQSQRYAGDAVVFGNAELRVPLGHLTLLTRGRLGVHAFADAGRVYVDGASPGGWHSAWGGGMWYSTMGITGTVAYALGEQRRVHAWLGVPF